MRDFLSWSQYAKGRASSSHRNIMDSTKARKPWQHSSTAAKTGSSSTKTSLQRRHRAVNSLELASLERQAVAHLSMLEQNVRFSSQPLAPLKRQSRHGNTPNMVSAKRHQGLTDQHRRALNESGTSSSSPPSSSPPPPPPRSSENNDIITRVQEMSNFPTTSMRGLMASLYCYYYYYCLFFFFLSHEFY